jgi:hypothetical protein
MVTRASHKRTIACRSRVVVSDASHQTGTSWANRPIASRSWRVNSGGAPGETVHHLLAPVVPGVRPLPSAALVLAPPGGSLARQRHTAGPHALPHSGSARDAAANVPPVARARSVGRVLQRYFTLTRRAGARAESARPQNDPGRPRRDSGTAAPHHHSHPGCSCSAGDSPCHGMPGSSAARIAHIPTGLLKVMDPPVARRGLRRSYDCWLHGVGSLRTAPS